MAGDLLKNSIRASGVPWVHQGDVRLVPPWAFDDAPQNGRPQLLKLFVVANGGQHDAFPFRKPGDEAKINGDTGQFQAGQVLQHLLHLRQFVLPEKGDMGFYQGMLGGVVGAADRLELEGGWGGEEDVELGAGWAWKRMQLHFYCSARTVSD